MPVAQNCIMTFLQFWMEREWLISGSLAFDDDGKIHVAFSYYIEQRLPWSPKEQFYVKVSFLNKNRRFSIQNTQ